MRLFLTILCFAWLSGKSQNMALPMQFSERILYSPPLVTYDTVQVNLWDSVGNIGKLNLTGWNDVNIPANANGAQFSYNLLYTTGAQSPISFAWRLNDKTSRAITAYVDNGSGYASGQTTNFPTAGFRSAAYVTPADLTYLMFKGLDDSKTYRLELICSRNTGTSLSVNFSYGAASDTVSPNGNTTKVIVLDNLTPSGGTIDILMDYLTGSFGFINELRFRQTN